MRKKHTTSDVTMGLYRLNRLTGAVFVLVGAVRAVRFAVARPRIRDALAGGGALELVRGAHLICISKTDELRAREIISAEQTDRLIVYRLAMC